MSITIDKYLQALCKLHEDSFTKTIIKPLFESMGYDRVEFNGGAYERGRDLIAQKRQPPKRDMYLVYVQSKKIGNIQNTSTAEKLSTLIHQLRQCCTGELSDPEGHKIKPNAVFLACPEQITTRLREEIETQLFNISPTVYIYDGPSIIEDIKHYKPELLDLLTDFRDKLTKGEDLGLANTELLSALKTKIIPITEEFYSDLSFYVGSINSNYLLHSEIYIPKSSYKISYEVWKRLKIDIQRILNTHKLKLIAEDIEILENDYIKKIKLYNTKSNKNLIKDLAKIETEISEYKLQISKLLKNLETNISNNKDILKKTEYSKQNEILNYLQSENENIIRKKIPSSSKEDFYVIAKLIIESIQAKNKLLNKSIKSEAKIIGKPELNISLNRDEIVDKISSCKENYLSKIELINNKKLNKNELKSFLIETRATLEFISIIKNEKSILSKFIVLNYNKSVDDRVSITPQDVFSTGYDIAVYGSAGAGKTTTLKSYCNTQNTDRYNIVYIALNRVVEDFKSALNKVKQNEQRIWLETDLLCKIILISKGFKLTKSQIQEFKSFLETEPTLVLDGLDEIYNVIPGIISAISNFKKNYSSIQLIISSRDSVSYLNDIEFLGITLLPFTNNQLIYFINGWFNDELSKAESLINSIEDKDLYEYINTPLLATITCALIDNGINPPSCEYDIYSKRLKLLTGSYDSEKNIKRQTQSGELLAKCAARIAFEMHKRGLRSASNSLLIEILTFHFLDIYEVKMLEKCLEELISPCDVLIFEPISNTYSFGHFRFQEHLAANILISDRNIDIADLIIQDWWIGALSLYAQHSNISFIFEDLYRKYGNIKRSKNALTSMINYSPKSVKEGLNDLMTKYLKADDYDEFILDDQDQYQYQDEYQYNF